MIPNLPFLRRRTLAAIASVAGSGPFSPLSLSPAIWLKADTGTNQTVGGTAATADGDPVGEWLDLSGNGRHVAQATASKRATIKLAIQNGMPVIRFDGVDDFLQAVFGLTIAQPITLFAAMKWRTAAATRLAISGIAVSPKIGLAIFPGANIDVGAGNDTTTTSADTTFRLFEILWNGASSSLRIDGGAAFVVDAGNQGTTGLNVGAFYDGSSCADIDVGELVLTNSVLSAGDAAAARAYIRSRWGTP